MKQTIKQFNLGKLVKLQYIFQYTDANFLIFVKFHALQKRSSAFVSYFEWLLHKNKNMLKPYQIYIFQDWLFPAIDSKPTEKIFFQIRDNFLLYKKGPIQFYIVLNSFYTKN